MRFYRETSLEDMCLAVIVSNFNMLSRRYNQSELCLWFLRRKYSQAIYEKFKKNDMLEERHINWLFSPEWKDIYLGSYHNLSSFVLKFQIYGKFINSVSFENSEAKLEILSAIVCLLPNVTDLNLNRTDCTDDLLLLIRKVCPQLNSLQLAFCHVTDKGMKNLCHLNREKVGFPSLRLLDIEETDVKLHGIKYVLSNLNLHVLKHYDLELVLCVMYVENRYKPREEFKTFDLKHLPLLPSKAPMLTLNVLLAMCPNVEKIRIMNALRDKDYDVLEMFQNINSLTILNLAAEEYSPNGLSCFIQRRGSFLTELVLEDSVVSVGVIVKTCCNLKKLELTCVEYQDFDETEIERKHNLKILLKLRIKSAKLYQSTNYKSINLLLKSCENLEILSLYNVRNFQEILVDHIITYMPNLIKAKFTYVDMNLISAKKLFACENLKHLYLDACPYLKTEDLSMFSECNSHSHSTISWQIEYNSINESFDLF